MTSPADAQHQPTTYQGDAVSRFRPIVQSALLRALRTFLQSFLAVVTAAPVLDLDVPTVKAAAAAGLAAVLALVMRWLDTTDVPTIPAG